MKHTTFARRCTAWLLCLAFALSLLPLGIVSAGLSGDLIAYVANENENLFKEDYASKITAANSMSEQTAHNWSGFAWRGDEVSSRVDILTRNKKIEDVTLSASDFVSENGDKIDKSNVAFTYLEAVKIEETLLPGHSYNGKTLFDVITRHTTEDLEAKQLYSAWVAIKVPESTKAGVYTGTLSLSTGNTTYVNLTYTLTVYDMVQPELESYVDLWMWPYNSIRYYSGQSTEEFWGTETADAEVSWEVLWNTRLDEKYFPALESELELYAKAGGDTIYAQVNERNRTNGDPCPSLVKWTRHTDGSMSFDYTDFDKWVELNMKYGIDKQIKVYDPGVFRCTMAYFDEKAGEVRTQSDRTSGVIWKRFWGAFLEDFIEHLDEKGWFDITYIALDEKDINITQNVINLVNDYQNKDGKTLQIATAVATYQCEEIFDEIDDLSIAYGLSNSHLMQVAADRKEKGLITTIYTCGPQGSSMLNTPGESAMSIHDCYRQGEEIGFLRWALQKYTGDPFASSLNYNSGLCSGDMYLIYPDYPDEGMTAQSTPRYEKLCEALRDIEKADYLKAELPEMKNDLHAALVAAKDAGDFRDVLNRFCGILAEDEAPEFFSQAQYAIPAGESTDSLISEDAQYIIDQQSTQTYLDEWAFTFSDGWTGEGHYFNLFFCSTNHYTSSSTNRSYEFDFYGDSVAIFGTSGRNYGKCDVYIDDELVGTLDQYRASGGRFTNLFEIRGLDSGDHRVKVVGAGKNASANGSNLHVDYAVTGVSTPVTWKSSNEDVFTVSEDGSVTGVGVGKATLTVTCGDFTASTVIEVTPTAKALLDKVAELEQLALDKADETTAKLVDDAITAAKAVAGKADPSEEEVYAAYEELTEAEAALVESITLTYKPIMLTYTLGEEFSVAGGLVTVDYKTGDSKQIRLTADLVSAVDLSKTGVQTVTVSLWDKTASYEITVNEPADTVAAFTDVLEGKWYVEAVDYAVGHGMFNGISKTEFKPNTAMNRAMLVSVLYRIEGSPEVTGVANPFDDVEAGKYFTNAVLWASSNDIVNGVSAGRFAPTNNITREQMATILYRYSGKRGFDVSDSADLSTYPDGASTSNYAQEALSWANGAGLITGTKSGEQTILNPKGNATRAQVATILMRFQQMIVAE